MKLFTDSMKGNRGFWLAMGITVNDDTLTGVKYSALWVAIAEKVYFVGVEWKE